MKKLAIIPISLIIFSSCLKKKAIEPKEAVVITQAVVADTIIKFQTELMTEIFSPTCNVAGCHIAGGGLEYFTSHGKVSDRADKIIDRLTRATVAEGLMPKGGPALNDSLITKIKTWIRQGKKNN